MRKKAFARRISAAAVSAVLACGFCMPLACSAEDAPSAADSNDLLLLSAAADDALYELHFERENSYSDYYDANIGMPRPDREILIYGKDCSDSTGSFSVGSLGADGDERDDVLIWDAPEGNCTFDFDVEEEGIYAPT